MSPDGDRPRKEMHESIWYPPPNCCRCEKTDTADFLVGGSGMATALTIIGEGEIGVA